MAGIRFFKIEKLELETQLQEEGKLLGLTRISIDHPTQNPYMLFVQKLVETVVNLRNDLENSKAPRLIKNDINSLHDYLHKIFVNHDLDIQHISPYKLAFMVHAVNTARKNFKDFNDNKTAQKLRTLIKQTSIDCGIPLKNLLLIKSDYTPASTVIKNKRFQALKSLIGHIVFWRERGNLRLMVDIINLCKIPPFTNKKWEEIQERTRTLDYFMEAHEDITELCRAIRENDIRALRALESKAGEEELAVPWQPCPSMKPVSRIS